MKEVRISTMDLLQDDFKASEMLEKSGFDLNKKIEKELDNKTNEVVYRQND